MISFRGWRVGWRRTRSGVWRSGGGLNLICQCNAGNGAEGAEKSDTSRDHVEFIRARFFGLGVECDVLWVLDENAVAALEHEQEPAKWHGADQALNLRSNGFNALH